MGHARRIRGELEKAQEAFRRFQPLWQESEGAPGPLDEARVRELAELLDNPEEP